MTILNLMDQSDDSVLGELLRDWKWILGSKNGFLFFQERTILGAGGGSEAFGKRCEFGPSQRMNIVFLELEKGSPERL